MSSSASELSIKMRMQNIFQGKVSASSSLEPPIEEWLSLIALPSVNSHKIDLYKQGLYDPGSGEICTKYIPMSSSSIFKHPYYAYPSIKDPGIRKALLEPEEKKIYPLDGQELYVNLCEEMKVIPVRRFFRGLLGETIDLRYYGVNPVGVRAMTQALNYNKYVRRLDLTSNFLNEDACYHLGQMLRENFKLQELVLCGCRIQEQGIRRLVMNLAIRPLDLLDLSRNQIGDEGFKHLASQLIKGALIRRIQEQGIRRLVMNLAIRPLDLLDLSRNQIGDEGFKHLASQLIKGALIRRLNLSYNELTSASAVVFASAVEGNNTITHLDLSWNKMYAIKGVNDFLSELSESKVLVELNMSWNAMKISQTLKKLLTVPKLRILDLSNNRITQTGVTAIANGLSSAKSLHTLDLSYNPITSHDAFLLVHSLRTESIKLTNLLMDNVAVNKKFIKERAEVLSLSFRRNSTITHGPVLHNYELSTTDMREIIMKRLYYLSMKGTKGAHFDIAGYFLQKNKTLDNMQPREIFSDLKIAGISVDEGLVVSLSDMFPGPKLEKGEKSIDLAGIIEIIKLLWPDSKAHPTSPEIGEIIDQKMVDDIKRKKKKK